MKTTKKTFYITTPIYYASGNLHLGHLYCSTLAQTFALYKKMMGYDVKFLTGSDEHGAKIEQKAKLAILEPQQYVDGLIKNYKELWKKWDINFDYFSRTTDKQHEELIANIFEHFLKQGIIYKAKYQGWYSINDEEYLTETQAVKDEQGNLFHPTSGHQLTLISEESYFFKMSAFEKWWLKEVDDNPNWLRPIGSVIEMKNNFVLKGLEDLSVTRKNVQWGIKVKSDPQHTIYVWLDALFNYVSALGFDLKKSKADYLKYWQEGTEIVHLLGKEIARFHFIYWPIFLNALNLKQPTNILVHGLLRDKEGRKMSKSLNNIVDLDSLLEKFDPEMVKYYLCSQIRFGEDGNFSEAQLKEKVNAELINTYGNLISRTLKMKFNSFPNGIVYKKSNTQIHNEIEQLILQAKNDFIKHMDKFELQEGLQVAINLASSLNSYIDKTQPWKLTNNLEELNLVISRLLNGIYAVSTFLQMILPKKIKEVANALKVKEFSIEQIDKFNKFDNLIQEEKFILFDRLK
ncbi:methionine--tRNA ligase [Mycoplasmopsis hyopharyngis]|uniref:methionine--tRNA ligase n=1 Tax=Mycoplasmopsis hyopharyngis TaxID=29558 RepID=UPI0038734C3F